MEKKWLEKACSMRHGAAAREVGKVSIHRQGSRQLTKELSFKEADCFITLIKEETPSQIHLK